MATISTKDGTEIYYKDWGKGRPVVFSHGWPLSADAWEDQMVFLGERGYRVIAHDRRGHGRSSQPFGGNDMDTYTDDLAALFEKLDLKGAVLIGHSTGGGEVTRYIGRHGTSRLSRAVLMSAVPPHQQRHRRQLRDRRWLDQDYLTTLVATKRLAMRPRGPSVHLTAACGFRRSGATRSSRWVASC